MRHILGHCDLSSIRVLSVIPIRQDRIQASELHYGAEILGLDPQKSVLENKYGYKFDPYEQYSRNVYKNDTCLYNFLDGHMEIPHANPTKGHFECLSEDCKASVALVSDREKEQLKKLIEKFPLCDYMQMSMLFNSTLP